MTTSDSVGRLSNRKEILVRHGQERNRGEHDHHATNESSSEEEDEAGLILLPEFSAFRFLDLHVGVRFRLPVLCDRHLVIAGRILLLPHRWMQ